MARDLTLTEEMKPVTNPGKLDLRVVEKHGVSFLKSLQALGVEVLTEPEGHIENMPTIKYKPDGPSKGSLEMAVYMSSLDIPFGTPSNSEGNIITLGEPILATHSFYTMSTTLALDAQPFEFFMMIEPRGFLKYQTYLVMKAQLDNGLPRHLGSVPSAYTNFAFQYDFDKHPAARSYLERIASRRVPADVYDNKPGRQSEIRSTLGSDGYDTHLRLFMQKANASNHLRCYEVEIFDNDGKNPDYTTDLVPESIWQSEENHYCMAENETFPLIPLPVEKMSKLVMNIHVQSGSMASLSDIIGDIPLSVEGNNQWYATTDQTSGISIYFNPQFERMNTILVYKNVFNKKPTPLSVTNAMAEMARDKAELERAA